jgi:hypothetical protein
VLSALCVLVDPYGNTAARALEHTITLFVDFHLSLLPAQYIGPDLALVLGTDVHLDLAGTGVAHNNRTSVLAIVGASSDEAYAVCIVPVVIEITVSVQLACEDEVSELVAARRRFGVVALHAVEIAVEDTGVSVTAEKNQRVGERLEETFNGRLDGLPWLCIMIDDYCLCCRR